MKLLVLRKRLWGKTEVITNQSILLWGRVYNTNPISLPFAQFSVKAVSLIFCLLKLDSRPPPAPPEILLHVHLVSGRVQGEDRDSPWQYSGPWSTVIIGIIHPSLFKDDTMRNSTNESMMQSFKVLTHLPGPFTMIIQTISKRSDCSMRQVPRELFPTQMHIPVTR